MYVIQVIRVIRAYSNNYVFNNQFFCPVYSPQDRQSGAKDIRHYYSCTSLAYCSNGHFNGCLYNDNRQASYGAYDATNDADETTNDAAKNDAAADYAETDDETLIFKD